LRDKMRRFFICHPYWGTWDYTFCI